ncbi:DUF2759 domain-containing protein [Caldibacillus lycopersici]|uniref:DUF2759 domain-containing protein n=1 Tax=Perspicuibacillus lycopersici TaxID=1325689 RepID=A0AAE3ISL2_9BACI|nr:DUF2759 domain-containing protein [Perspicuibacillus lycopersici]MCU9613868.1 DUF2759 domain-containing protein [Perspicuibacillus lycopersici]
MGTVIITGLITILALFAIVSCLKNKNFLGLVLSIATVGVFGFFTVMTIIFQGFPEA